MSGAKFKRNSRILKKYTAVCKKRPPIYAEGLFKPDILLIFNKKNNKILCSDSLFLSYECHKTVFARQITDYIDIRHTGFDENSCRFGTEGFIYFYYPKTSLLQKG